MAKKEIKQKQKTMQKAIVKTESSMQLILVMLFQFTAMIQLAFRNEYSVDMNTLALAAVMPAITFGFVKGTTKIWRIDRGVLTMVLFLCSVSVITLTSIKRNTATVHTQMLYICVGMAAMLIGIAFIRNLKKWRRWIVPLMLFSLAFIALPLVVGEWKNGAKNWIGIERNGETLISIQPSEFVKVSLLVVLAGFLSERQSKRKTFAAIVFGALLCCILLVERDLGALLLYFFATIILYFLATSDALISLAGLCAGGAGGVGAYFMFDYVKKRFDVWRNPWRDTEGSGYQITQALIAIGSGGFMGMGLGLGYSRDIPLYYSDFIYAAICEEFGWIFALLLLAVYAIIVMRGISIAMNARTSFHALLAAGVVVMLGIQTLLIVGGNTNLLPLTGVVLPFIAAGGSSMVSYMGAIGLLLGISSLNADADEADRKKPDWRYGGIV